MLQTKRQLRLEELEKVIKKRTELPERKGLYEQGKAKDECERRGFPQELYSIME